MDEHEALALLDARARFGMKPGLDAIRGLLRELGDPHLRLKVVHVGGTNGKGSVCAMIDAALLEAGHRTGLYTSPHLVSFRERIRVDGRDVAPDELGAAMERLRPALDKFPEATYFEVATALALDHFARSGVEIAVLEVGLGGRLDATNVHPSPLVTVVTNISLEHTDVLGKTVEEIAREKGGIVKEGRPLVTGATGVALAELRAIAGARGASVRVLGEDLIGIPLAEDDEGQTLEVDGVRDHGEVRIPLNGAHQVDNAALALAALDEIDRAGVPVPVDAARRGFARTRWPGRLQRVPGQPALLLDGAHNPAGMRTLVAHLQARKLKPVVLFGALQDKDWRAMVETLAPYARDAVVTRPPSPRGLDPQDGARAFSMAGLFGIAVEDPEHALDTARNIAGPDGLVLVTGSLYLVGDVLSRVP